MDVPSQPHRPGTAWDAWLLLLEPPAPPQAVLGAPLPPQTVPGIPGLSRVPSSTSMLGMMPVSPRQDSRGSPLDPSFPAVGPLPPGQGRGRRQHPILPVKFPQGWGGCVLGAMPAGTGKRMLPISLQEPGTALRKPALGRMRADCFLRSRRSYFVFLAVAPWVPAKSRRTPERRPLGRAALYGGRGWVGGWNALLCFLPPIPHCGGGGGLRGFMEPPGFHGRQSENHQWELELLH